MHQLVTHLALVPIRHDWNNGVFSNSPVVLGEVRDWNKLFKIDLPLGSPWHGFASVVRLGTRQIAGGTDHLLFLLVLLLPAALRASGVKWGEPMPFRQSMRRLVKIVTAFTLGHSLTLALGALRWIYVPSAPIETLIALSIFVSAVHALRPLFPGRKGFIVAGFGLIHGLAFAGVIADFHLDTWHTVQAILDFNIGIELMQLFVVAVTNPWLLLLARTTASTPFRTAGAVIAGTAALGWMAERVLGWSNPIGVWVEKAASHVVWIVADLAVLLVTMALLQRRHASMGMGRRALTGDWRRI